MNALEIIAVLALSGYAVHQQTRASEIRPSSRFTLPVVYAVVGLCVGGVAVPHGGTATTFLVVSLLLSVGVGLARGRLTRVWVEADGRRMRQGTAVTVGLFLALVVVKLGIGTYEYLAGIRDTAGFGEVLVMIALMAAVQAEIVWQRARRLGRPAPTAAFVATTPGVATR